MKQESWTYIHEKAFDVVSAMFHLDSKLKDRLTKIESSTMLFFLGLESKDAELNKRMHELAERWGVLREEGLPDDDVRRFAGDLYDVLMAADRRYWEEYMAAEPGNRFQV